MEMWCRSDIIHARTESLVMHGLPPARTEVSEWVIPGDEEVLAPPDGYVITFTPFHERGLAALPH
jgi:hypothetical protein